MKTVYGCLQATTSELMVLTDCKAHKIKAINYVLGSLEKNLLTLALEPYLKL